MPEGEMPTSTIDPFVVDVATIVGGAPTTGDAAVHTTLDMIESSVRAVSAPDAAALTMADCARSVLWNAAGDYENALQFATRASERDDIGHLVWALSELVEAAVRTGERDRARAAAARLEHITGTDDEVGVGVRARARALLACDADAEPLYRRAIDCFAMRGLALQRARAHLLYGEWLRRQGRRIDARCELHRALEDFVDHGYSEFADRAQREIAATCETARKRTPHSSRELTAQEAEIVRLVAEGHTNAEIGVILFLSPRTVEWHLRKVFTKLGITTRRALISKRTAVWAA
jgi:ATP/maltotriose-dependent transcriptional regulator MalT